MDTKWWDPAGYGPGRCAVVVAMVGALAGFGGGLLGEAVHGGYEEDREWKDVRGPARGRDDDRRRRLGALIWSQAARQWFPTRKLAERLKGSARSPEEGWMVGEAVERVRRTGDGPEREKAEGDAWLVGLLTGIVAAVIACWAAFGVFCRLNDHTRWG